MDEPIIDNIKQDKTFSNIEFLRRYNHHYVHNLPKILIKLKDLIYEMDDHNMDSDPIIDSYVYWCRIAIESGIYILAQSAPFSVEVDEVITEEIWNYIDEELVPDFNINLGKEHITGTTKNDLQIIILKNITCKLTEVFNKTTIDHGELPYYIRKLFAILISDPKYKHLGLFMHFVNYLYDEITKNFDPIQWEESYLACIDESIAKISNVIHPCILQIMSVHINYLCILDLWNRRSGNTKSARNI